MVILKVCKLSAAINSGGMLGENGATYPGPDLNGSCDCI